MEVMHNSFLKILHEETERAAEDINEDIIADVLESAIPEMVKLIRASLNNTA